nr:transposase [Bradyrhizobium vignae]
MRAHLAELGIIATAGLAKVEAQVAIVRDESDARLPAAARFALRAIADEIEASADQIERLERAIVVETKHDEDMRRLTTIPGVGAITAATIKALVLDPGGVKSARHFAAWLGLTPRPHSSGAKSDWEEYRRWEIRNSALCSLSGRLPSCGLSETTLGRGRG